MIQSTYERHSKRHRDMTKEVAEFIGRDDMMTLNTVNKAGLGFGEDAG